MRSTTQTNNLLVLMDSWSAGTNVGRTRRAQFSTSWRNRFASIYRKSPATRTFCSCWIRIRRSIRHQTTSSSGTSINCSCSVRLATPKSTWTWPRSTSRTSDPFPVSKWNISTIHIFSTTTQSSSILGLFFRVDFVDFLKKWTDKVELQPGRHQVEHRPDLQKCGRNCNQPAKRTVQSHRRHHPTGMQAEQALRTLRFGEQPERTANRKNGIAKCTDYSQIPSQRVPRREHVVQWRNMAWKHWEPAKHSKHRWQHGNTPTVRGHCYGVLALRPFILLTNRRFQGKIKKKPVGNRFKSVFRLVIKGFETLFFAICFYRAPTALY